MSKELETAIKVQNQILDELEVIQLQELFEKLNNYACALHDDLAMNLEFACSAWVKYSPHNAERAIRLMCTFIPLLGVLGRSQEIIMKQLDVYSKECEKFL